jgi:hypothetical protein
MRKLSVALRTLTMIVVLALMGMFIAGVTPPTPTASAANSSSRPRVITLGNFPTGGSIGLASATVDVADIITITQTTATQTLTVPVPSSTRYKDLIVINNGSAPFILNPGGLVGSNKSVALSSTGSGGFNAPVGVSRAGEVIYSTRTADYVSGTDQMILANGGTKLRSAHPNLIAGFGGPVTVSSTAGFTSLFDISTPDATRMGPGMQLIGPGCTITAKCTIISAATPTLPTIVGSPWRQLNNRLYLQPNSPSNTLPPTVNSTVTGTGNVRNPITGFFADINSTFDVRSAAEGSVLAGTLTGVPAVGPGAYVVGTGIAPNARVATVTTSFTQSLAAISTNLNAVRKNALTGASTNAVEGQPNSTYSPTFSPNNELCTGLAPGMRLAATTGIVAGTSVVPQNSALALLASSVSQSAVPVSTSTINTTRTVTLGTANTTALFSCGDIIKIGPYNYYVQAAAASTGAYGSVQQIAIQPPLRTAVAANDPITLVASALHRSAPTVTVTAIAGQTITLGGGSGAASGSAAAMGFRLGDMVGCTNGTGAAVTNVITAISGLDITFVGIVPTCAVGNFVTKNWTINLSAPAVATGAFVNTPQTTNLVLDIDNVTPGTSVPVAVGMIILLGVANGFLDDTSPTLPFTFTTQAAVQTVGNMSVTGTNVSYELWPYGAGDGVTTFGWPDMRGQGVRAAGFNGGVGAQFTSTFSNSVAGNIRTIGNPFIVGG